MSTMNDETWTPSSWRSKAVAQDVVYKNQEKLAQTLSKLQTLPPLVSSAEVLRLRSHLAQVAKGEKFLLQGGDCAESFDGCTEDQIKNNISLLLLMSLIIVWGGRKPVVRIARIAGQHAKPRSSAFETIKVAKTNEDGTKTVEEKKVMSYRGDNVNGLDVDDREADPERLLGSYFHSCATLNYIRVLLSPPSTFASLRQPSTWSFSHVRSAALLAEFNSIVSSLSDALDFMDVIGAAGNEALEGVELFTSHEGLMLEYEEKLTRKMVIPSTEKGTVSKEGWFDTSAHFLWIGDRTRQIDGAHVNFFRGIEDPIGLKVGPTMAPSELIEMLDILDPYHQPGKVTLIFRYGAKKIDQFLASHLQAIKSTTHLPCLVTDAMHGNTITSTTHPGVKTRQFEDIILEIVASIRIFREEGMHWGGVHLEMTGEVDKQGFSVTECTGGSMALKEDDLALRYNSRCDPRLNHEQSLDVAFLVSDALKAQRKGTDIGESEAILMDALVKRQAGRIA